MENGPLIGMVLTSVDQIQTTILLSVIIVRLFPIDLRKDPRYGGRAGEQEPKKDKY